MSNMPRVRDDASGLPMTHKKGAPPMRILIIEDEPMIALYLQELLEDAGFAIIGVASRLAKAMELIKSAVFDVAILDANLAGISSSPAAAALVARSMPFVVLSGYSMQQQQQAFPTPHFLQKPCRPEQLISMLCAIGPKP
jgi:CheY-like chemotaxis protein